MSFRTDDRSALLSAVLALCLVVACTPSGRRDAASRSTTIPGASDGQPSGQISPPRACEVDTLLGTMSDVRVMAREQPTPDAPAVAAFDRVNAQGATQVFPLLDRATRSGRTWYRVRLPMRPNGTTGWIPSAAVQLGRTGYRIRIDLSAFHLTLFEGCERIDRFRIGIGTRDTPTPRGTFYLNSLLEPPDPDSVYGALAFGLSAYSHVITDWEGGGIIGLHGTNDPSSIGRQVSHGCIRMTNDAIRYLARTVPLGTPVEIS